MLERLQTFMQSLPTQRASREHAGKTSDIYAILGDAWMFFSYWYVIILRAESELPDQEVDINYFRGNNYLQRCINDMQNPPKPPSPSASWKVAKFQIWIKDAQCAETYEKKTIFPLLLFLFFWYMVDYVLKILRKLTKISPKVANFFCPKRCAMLLKPIKK